MNKNCRNSFKVLKQWNKNNEKMEKGNSIWLQLH